MRMIFTEDIILVSFNMVNLYTSDFFYLELTLHRHDRFPSFYAHLTLTQEARSFFALIRFYIRISSFFFKTIQLFDYATTKNKAWEVLYSVFAES